MRHLGTLLLASLLLFSSACSERSPHSQSAARQGDAATSDSPQQQLGSVLATSEKEISVAARTASNDDFSARNHQYEAQKISLNLDGQNAPVTVVPERKVIRNAELIVEIESPVEAQRRLASIAESFGGFVVTSESRQDERTRGAQGTQVVSVEMRVPAARFDSVINGVRGVGGRVLQEKMTGRDVTEEYIDLEARLRAQRALEAQILEIMKRAQRVSDALEVNAQLAQVRSEIERLEGRRRFLENQSSLSTIKVTLQPPAPLVAAETAGFGTSVRRAFSDGLDFAAAITLGVVRVAVTLLPVAVLILLPAFGVWRVLRRRLARSRAGDDFQPHAQAGA